MSYIGNTPSQAAFVTDSFSGNGSTTAFTMSVAPANTASVLVAVSGVLQDPSTYSVVGTTLTFTGAPPSGTGNISCRYLGIPASGVTTTAYRTVTEFTATAGQTTFTPPSYTVGFINVYNNGVRLGSADYTATNGTTVVLTTGAALNDLVTVESFLVSSVLNAIPATAGAVNSTYLATGAALANIGAGGITQTYLDTSVVPLGAGQTWQDLTASRAINTTYTNSSGRPIMVAVEVTQSYSGSTSVPVIYLTIGGVVVGGWNNNVSQTTIVSFNGIVPNGTTYSLTSSGTIIKWSELR